MNNLKSGYIQNATIQNVKRYCQTLKLKTDSLLIEEYKFWHRPENCWEEIPKGLREIGILNMEIYIHDNTLFMIIETPVDFEWDSAFSKLTQLNRQNEWETFMEKYQITEANACSSDKWKLMERIFKL